MEEEELLPLKPDSHVEASHAKGKSNHTTDMSQFTTEGFNMCYLSGLFFTVSLGMIQFGYMIGSWNAASAAYSKKEGWDEDDAST